MNKFISCFKILFSDNYAVFTWKDANENSDYMTASFFSWDVKKYDLYFLNYIKSTIDAIINNYENK